MYDSESETRKHIKRVSDLLIGVTTKLLDRAVKHDLSKLSEEEKKYFDEYTPKLAECTYGSEEYKEFLKGLGVALEHHYVENRHHPEHFVKWNCNGCHTDYKIEHPDICPICGYSQFQRESDMAQMSLIDITEMLCDWKAASERHNDGDIFKSIELNQKRFKYSDELKKILINTAKQL